MSEVKSETKVEFPKWFDETAQYGFFNLEGYQALSDQIFDKDRRDNSFWSIYDVTGKPGKNRIVWKIVREAILIRYEVPGNEKAALILDAQWELETAQGSFDEWAILRTLAAFDYIFGCLYETLHK